MTDVRWLGAAQLLDKDGIAFDEVSVSLFRFPDGTWNGRVTNTTFQGGPWEHIVRIRLLETGAEADIKLTERVKRLTDGTGEVRDAYIEGIGPAPF